MMKTAWDGYSQYAWGTNELMPKARQGHSAGIFGKYVEMGIDSNDKLKQEGESER